MITNVGEDVDKQEPSCTSGGSVKWHSHFGKQISSFSKELNINYHVTQQLYSWVFAQEK